MSVSGLGPTQIAKKLKTEQIPTPTEYWHSTGKKCGEATAIPCNWCSAHFIRERTVEALVLEGLQRLLGYVQTFEAQFAREQMERFGVQEKKALTAKRRELEKSKQRVAEIDRLIRKSYEDMSKGLITEGRFAAFSISLENEQTQLKEAILMLETELETTTNKATDLQHFMERARQVTRLTELTPEIVHEFIEKIVVYQPEKMDGKRINGWTSTTTPSACGSCRSRKCWNGSICTTTRP